MLSKIMSGLFSKVKQYKAERDWNNSTLGQALFLHTEQYFKYPSLASFSDESKKWMVADFYQQVQNILQSDNQRQALRECLAKYVANYASYEVLSLNEKEKKDGQFANCPYISGELYKHLDKVIEHNSELGEIKWKQKNISDDDLIGYLNTRSMVMLYYMNGLNIFRLVLKDNDDIKDWFKPFVAAMMVWEEDTVRGKIGLPKLSSNDLNGLMYPTFFNYGGEWFYNLLYEWEKAYPELVAE